MLNYGIYMNSDLSVDNNYVRDNTVKMKHAGNREMTLRKSSVYGTLTGVLLQLVSRVRSR